MPRRIVTPLFPALAILAILPVFSACGRVGYGEAPPIAQVDIRALEGTRLFQGDSLEIEVRILPAEAAAFGRSVTLTAAPGRLDGRESLTVSAENGTTTLTLSAGMDVRDGRMLLLESDAPVTGGDLRYLVESGPRNSVTVPSGTYDVAYGLDVEAAMPMPSVLDTRPATIAKPTDGSDFGVGPIVVAGDPLEVFDGSTGALVPISLEGATIAPGRIAQAHFTSSSTDYGDLLFVCVAGATGGLYSIDSAGTVSSVRPGGCNGVIRYGDFLYMHSMENTIIKLPAGSDESVVLTEEDGLPTPEDGFILGTCPSGFFDVKLVIFSGGSAGVGADGLAMALEPWDAPIPWAQGLAEPVAAVYDGDLPYGVVMIVALQNTGEVIALRDDGTQMPILSGLTDPAGVAPDGEGGIWVLDRGADTLLRIVRAGL